MFFFFLLLFFRLVLVLVKVFWAFGKIGLLGFPGDSVVKNPPVMKETQVLSLSLEDPLEKGMATHSSILAWSLMGNLMDRGAWWASVPGNAKSGTLLSI